MAYVGVNMVTLSGETALAIAARNGYLNIAQQLFEFTGIDILLALPLHAAAENGHTSILALLLRPVRTRQQQLRNVAPDGRTALHAAAAKGHQSAALNLILADSNLVEVQDNHGRTPLHYAAEFGHDSVILFLVMNSLIPDKYLDTICLLGTTPLFLAIKSGANISAVEQLLSLGTLHTGNAMLNYKYDTDNFSGTILDLALDTPSSPEVLELLNKYLDRRYQ